MQINTGKTVTISIEGVKAQATVTGDITEEVVDNKTLQFVPIHLTDDELKKVSFAITSNDTEINLHEVVSVVN